MYVSKELNEMIGATKQKILTWLREEAFSPEEMPDPNAHFNFGIKVAGSPLHVVQKVHTVDSIFVGANLVLTPDQLDLLGESMDGKKRQEFFWDLRLALLSNSELGDFQVKPNPPHDVREVFITSRRVFYDALTKDRLILAIQTVYKAVMMVVWMLERYAGKITPKESQSPIANDLQMEIDGLVREAYDLLPEIIETTRPSDLRAKSQNAKWWNRHRLHVLLDAAEETRRKLSRNIVVAPWFLAEFKATLEIVRRWKDDPEWKHIEPSLKNKGNFTHTIGKLRIAEHFMTSDHKVEIVPREKDATPDFRIQAIGGTQDWLYVECYQPAALAGEPKEVPEKKLDGIVEKAMAKAKRQFGKKNPGVTAIFGYNQPTGIFENLKQKIANRLDQTDRPYLAGFLVLAQSILVRNSNGGISFAPILRVEFISNPSYFGRIDIVSGIPDNDSKSREPPRSITTNEFLEKEIDSLARTLRPEPQALPRGDREMILSLIEEPEQLNRTIVNSSNREIFPFFRGKGNIDYVCGNCHAVLAEHIWNLSLSNIVVLCSSCQSFNEFPRIGELKYPVKGTIAVERGIYSFSRSVILKQGVTLFGV